MVFITVMVIVVSFSFDAECRVFRYPEYRYAECHYAECHYAE